MKKRTLKTIGIVSASLALTVTAAFPAINSNANKETSIDVAQNNNVKELIGYEQSPTLQYNVLPTITSKNLEYKDVKDKDVILAYSSNNSRNGYNKMDMNVVEYETDGVTPKVVNFSSQVATVQSADISYVIYALTDEEIDMIGTFTFDSAEEKSKIVVDTGYQSAGFLDTEQENTKKNIVVLESDAEDYKTVKQNVIYTEVTYSINGEPAKTVYAWANTNMKPDTAIIESVNYEVEIYANVGDKIDYTVKVPTLTGDVYKNYSAVVVAE